jgi:site-specific DNA-methyltransferase (adenine-specific)
LPGEKKLRAMVIEVKGGKNGRINAVRPLRGALERDEADMAGLIIMEPLPDCQRQQFLKEMNAGMLDVMGVQHPRMQILSVPEILDKRMFLTPSVAGRGTGQGNLPLQDTR